MNETIISLAAGKSQLPLIKSAKKMGLQVVAIDRNPSAPGFDFADIIINENKSTLSA